MRSRLIPARFNGKCRQCGRVVAKGEPVFFAKHYGVRCVSCGTHTADDAPLPSKRSEKGRYGRRPAEPQPAAEPPMTVPNAGRLAAWRGEDGIHRYEFKSVREAVEDALQDYAQNDTNRKRIRASQEQALSGEASWGNYFTKERLLAEVFNPSAELRSAIDRMRERLVDGVELPTAARRRVRRGLDYGDEIDADRWLVREPNCWERTVREPQPRRTVTIGCNVVVSGGHKPEQLLYRGAAALALADLLTRQGCNVQIVMFKCASEPTSHVSQSVFRYELKAPDMPLDLSAIAFAMCEIAFCRTVAVCGGYRHLPGVLKSGFGTPSDVPAADREGVDYLIDRDVLSEEAATEWLRKVLKVAA
jgi:hypothetical protein